MLAHWFIHPNIAPSIYPSSHYQHTSVSEEKWGRLIPPRDIEVLWWQGKTQRETAGLILFLFFTSNARLISSVACVRLCNCSIFNMTNMKPGGWEAASDERSGCVPPCWYSCFYPCRACFRYALLVFAAAVHKTCRRMSVAKHSRRTCLTGVYVWTCVCACGSERVM